MLGAPISSPASWMATSSPMPRTAAFSFKPWRIMRESKYAEANAHLNSIDQKATRFMKGGSNRQRKILDR